jgi:hypothetical protein
MWSIEDLKTMANPASVIYTRALEKGIPEGMARNFSRDLRVFKRVWRATEALTGLGSTPNIGGGF